jgi:hypothetical protein
MPHREVNRCGDPEPTSPGDSKKTCLELGDSLKQAVGSDRSAFKVIAPNGGETYHIGDSINIRATSNVNESNALLEIVFTQPGDLPNIFVLNANTNMNLYAQCDIPFVIPDSLTYRNRKFSTVGDSIKVRASDYNASNQRDLSDGYFRILPKS